MSKGLIAFIIVAALGSGALVVLYMNDSAGKARKRSDQIMQDFKTIDNSLKEHNTTIDEATRRLLDSLQAKTGK